MEIVSSKDEIIFRKDYNGKPSYSLGLQKRSQNNEFINGYIKVNFRKGTELQNKTKIKVKNGWIDFYKEGEKTIPTLFIEDFDIVKEEQKEPNPFEEFGKSIKTEVGHQIQIEDEDLPF